MAAIEFDPPVVGADRNTWGTKLNVWGFSVTDAVNNAVVSLEPRTVEGELHYIAIHQDDSETDLGPLPIAPGGSDEGVATYIATPGSETQAALNAQTEDILDSFWTKYTTILVPVSNYLLPGETMPNDGVADATPLFQRARSAIRAMAAANAPFGNICYVMVWPAGRFRHTQSFNLSGGTAGTPEAAAVRIGVQGAGRNATVFLPEGNTHGIAVNSPDPDQPCATGCYFADFTIDLAGSTRGDYTTGVATYKGFVGRGWKDCTFERIDIRNSPATAFGVDFPIRCVVRDMRITTTGPGLAGAMDETAGPIAGARNISGVGQGFGAFDDESEVLINVEATDCWRGGFFYETYEQSTNSAKRNAPVRMIGCRSWRNRIGISEPGAGFVQATNCEVSDNKLAGYYGGTSGLVQWQASRDSSFDHCQFLRNGVGLYFTGDFTTTVGHDYTALRPAMGGIRVTNCLIEDNVGAGILGERIQTIEAGGFHVRGNIIRRNGANGIVLRNAIDAVRDLVIADNYLDGNVGAGIKALVAMNAPDISSNTFVNATGTAQTNGLVLHPAEPVLAPRIKDNTFRRMTTPMRYVSRLEQTYVTGNRILDADADPTVPPRAYREAFYGGTNQTWPTSGDGWAKNSAGTTINWRRETTGIRGVSGTDDQQSLIYRDLGGSGMFVSGRFDSTTQTADKTQSIGVMHSLASSSARTAVIAGLSGTNGFLQPSNFYAVWKLVSNVPTKVWESTVPRDEGHSIALARKTGATLTDVFIDGELATSLDITDVPATSLAGVFTVTRLNQTRHISEIRAMAYDVAGPAPVTPATILTSDAFTAADGTSMSGRSTDAALGGSAAAWSVSGTAPQISSNGLVNQTTASTLYASVTSTSATPTDGRIAVKVAAMPAADCHVFGRCAVTTLPADCYAMLLRADGSLKIGKYVGTTFTNITGAPVLGAGSVKAGDVIELAAIGSTLRLYLNGVLIGSVTDTSFTTGSRWGLRLSPGPGSTVNTLRFDDLVLYDK